MLRFDIPQIQRILDVAQRHITTNLTATDMTWFATQMLNVRLEDMVTHTLPGESFRVRAASVWSLYRAEAMQIINGYYNPFLTDIPAGNFNIFQGSRRYAASADASGTTMARLLGN